MFILSYFTTGKIHFNQLNDSPTQKQSTMDLLSPDTRRSFQEDEREIAKIMVDGYNEHVYKSVLVCFISFLQYFYSYMYVNNV